MGMCKPSDGKTSITGKIGDLKAFGIPNTRIDMYDIFGKLIQQRWYGPDGRAIMNRDWKHNDPYKIHKFLHDHPWDWTKKKSRQDYDEQREIDINYC